MMQEKYPERHWTYEDQEDLTQMPAFMNDGYAPPDWDLIQALEQEEDPSTEHILRS
ncbi:MAG: hypothetical protein GXO55_04055 [Chloroflexi bacterium]|nr:hypothetical protein [Chloroflexota bacterium]